MPQNHFVGAAAKFYDATSPEMFDPALLKATADFLATEARGGPALEFGIGTGRVALPLSERGIRVHGVDISEDHIGFDVIDTATKREYRTTTLSATGEPALSSRRTGTHGLPSSI
jgi:2-polyprenyl-3-methyl-5-hydroxy-6-metoxy-1,4-benzoquinol methylase